MRSLPSNLFVCTNMDFSKFNKTMKEELGERCPPHRILTIGEKKIGLLGYLTPNVMEPLKVPEVHIEDEIEALTREVAVLRKKGIKLIVALGHSGYERDQEIAHRVPSLDVIVGGHSHTLLWPDPISHQAPGVPPDPADAGNVRGPYPTVVVQPSGRRVLLLHAFFGGKYVGNINITFNADDEVKDWWPQPQLLDESMPQDPDTKEVMDDLQEQLTNRSHDVIGKSLVQLVGMAEMCHQEECNLGNLMGDAMLWALRMYVPDVPIQLPMVALVNSGLMRNNIQVGDVTPRMLTEALSWRNLVEVIVINGSMLHAALEHGSSTVEQRHGRFMQVSGISYQIDMSKPPYHRVSHVHVLSANDMIPESRLLNHSQHYHVALTNFIADGGDGFHMFTPPISRQSFGILDISLLQNYIIARSPVFAVVEDRIRMILPSGDGEEEHHHSGAGRPAVHLQHRPLLAAATALLVGAVAAAVVTS
ncbi:Protein 5NUC [Amphibalanus amphitrite]|uniref:5'-nucleotidase n=2 Tax=Amphibalanus amphitrite TaxID=1232801 RepID=A0A6A4WNA1_AMPAM|nr:Protein 5NUC [Amphibalanus amphitrite]